MLGDKEDYLMPLLPRLIIRTEKKPVLALAVPILKLERYRD